MPHPFFCYSVLLFDSFEQIAAVIAAKVLLGGRTLDLPCSPRPHLPATRLSLKLQLTFKVARRPVVFVVQRSSIDLLGTPEKGHNLLLIQPNV